MSKKKLAQLIREKKTERKDLKPVVWLLIATINEKNGRIPACVRTVMVAALRHGPKKRPDLAPSFAVQDLATDPIK